MIEHARELSEKHRTAIRELMRAPGASGVACGEHDPAWLDILRQALHHRTSVLLDWRGKRLAGALPLALTRSPLFGKHLVSLPYVNRAGLLTTSLESGHALVEHAARLAEQHDARYLELRHHGRAFDSEPFTHCRNEKHRMVLDLPATNDLLWSSLRAKVRNQVRKGEQGGLKIHYGRESLVAGFYGVFATNMRDLGTPVYPRKLFRAMLHHLGERCQIALVTLESVPIAGAILVHDRVGEQAITQVPSASCLRQFNNLCANMWMYYQLLERSISRGATQFDFGRSSEGSGTYRFKKQWGAEPQPTPWQVVLRRGALDDARPDDPRNRKRIEKWQKLPVWVTKAIGPTIVRGIP
ncbi:MAG: FemAB family PEP-CTERM system-associated protein [Phycisphaeraceae bacterium]|nr:FemAB family PEP-CTERM system-associated protein [Phycisphaeraceae bacterium]